MPDDNFFVLLRPEAGRTKATVVTKIKHKYVVDTGIDKRSKKVLIVALLSEGAPSGFVERHLMFDDWRLATEIREFFIDEKRMLQLHEEKRLMEQYLNDCEREANLLL